MDYQCSKPPLCIERWVLSLQQYTFTVTYKQGKHGTRLPVVEDSDHLPSPTVNGKLGMLNNDDVQARKRQPG